MKGNKPAILAILFTAFSGLLMAQPPKKTTQKAEIKVPALCEECKGVIENALWKRVDGILYVEEFPKKKMVRVTFATDRIDLDNVRLRIADLGFDADAEKGSPDGYKKLPKECRDRVPQPAPVPEEKEN